MEYAPNHWQNAERGRSREVASRSRTTPRPTAPLAMRAMAVEFPQVHGHPNRLPFEGVLTLIDVASDKAPSGARGHRVVLSRAAAEAALPSLLGMAVDYKAGWDGHDARQKCGIITSAELDGNRITVAGFVDSGAQCAELQHRLKPRELARAAVELAREYSTPGEPALLVIERNNHGHGVLAHLEKGEPYERVYEHGGVSGWLTTAVSKPAMISNLDALLAERPGLFLSKRLLEECRTFVSHANGRTGATHGAHDDCVMAFAMGQAVRKQLLEGGRKRVRV
jgi:hypothetical protein